LYWQLQTSGPRTDVSECSLSHDNWPTPTVAEAGKIQNTAGYGQRGLSNHPAIVGPHTRPPLKKSRRGEANWPTPNARVSQDGEGLETWDRRRESLKARGINGNGAGTPLTIAVQMWPTPTVAIAKGGQTSRGGARKGEMLLGGLAAQNWPTPTSRDIFWISGPGRQERRDYPTDTLPNAVFVTEGGSWPTPTVQMQRAGDLTVQSASKELTRSLDRNGAPSSITSAVLGIDSRWPNGQAAQQSPSSTGSTRARLNSQWVAQLMGFPPDWCSVPDWRPSKGTATR